MTSWTIVVVSTTDWDAPQFGSRQQLALRLARRGHRVLYLEVARSLHTLISDPGALRRSLRSGPREREVAPGLVVHTPPPVLPHLYASGVMALNHRIVAAGAGRALERCGWSRTPDALLTYWPHTGALIDRLRPRVSVYHCIDDFVTVGYPLTTTRRIAHLEEDQCRRVDLVIDRSEALAARHRRAGAEPRLLQGGVDLELFDPERAVGRALDVEALPRPRIGMVGTVDDRLDCSLLAESARLLPEVSFVLAGPIKRHRVDLRRLEACPNVHLLPARPHPEVAAAIAALDLGLIPYRRAPETRALTPLKLYELLAMGKPVVATDLPYLRERGERDGGVRVVATAAELAAAVADALASPPSIDDRARWRRAAQATSWELHADRVESWIAELLAGARKR